MFNAANEMTAFNGTPMSYDLNGNLTGDGTNTYAWDARNHLSTLTSSGTTASFVYDALGRRALKNINSAPTYFVYDGLNPVQELTSAGGQFLPTANMFTGLGIDEFFQRSDVNGAQNFVSDQLHSTLALTNSLGSLATSYTYEPFGNVTITNSPLTDPNPYQFTGRESDGTGLDYYRARYYSATLQRFVSQDPKEFVNSTNLYGYVTDDPTDIADPTGEGFLNCGEQLLKLIELLNVYKTKHNERIACPADCRDQGHKKRLEQLQNPLNQQIETVRRACKNEFEALAQLAALENEYKDLATLLECAE